MEGSVPHVTSPHTHYTATGNYRQHSHEHSRGQFERAPRRAERKKQKSIFFFLLEQEACVRGPRCGDETREAEKEREC